MGVCRPVSNVSKAFLGKPSAWEDVYKRQLKSYANIVEGNALRMDWESVVPKQELNYIMGNPPFVGARMMSPCLLYTSS